MSEEQKQIVDIQDYATESKKEDGRVKIVSIEGGAYLRIRRFDEGTGKLKPTIIPMSSAGVGARVAEIEKELDLHKLLLADVQAAESKPE